MDTDAVCNALLFTVKILRSVTRKAVPSECALLGTHSLIRRDVRSWVFSYSGEKLLLMHLTSVAILVLLTPIVPASRAPLVLQLMCAVAALLHFQFRDKGLVFRSMLAVAGMHDFEGSVFRSNIFVPVGFIHTFAFLRNCLSQALELFFSCWTYLLVGNLGARCLVRMSALSCVPAHLFASECCCCFKS